MFLSESLVLGIRNAVLSHVSQTVSSHASLYAQLYLLFVYNSSILSRNDCALPKAIAEGGAAGGSLDVALFVL